MKILVTDDSRLARSMLIALLKVHFPVEHEIIQAENGKQAIELFKQHHPEYCFLDITMPHMNGIEALKLIKEKSPAAKVVMLSADIQNTSIEIARQCGAIYFIKKPIDEIKVKQAIEYIWNSK